MKRPVVLNAGDLAELAAIIDDPATWPAAVFTPTENVMARFNVLDAEVLAARTRRRVWSFSGTLALCAAAFGAWLLLPAVLGTVLTGAPQ